MLFRNTLAQSGSLLVGYLFSFLLAPVMISRLGLDKFGVWAVTGAFATYAGLLDLGIGRALTRFIAIYDAEDDGEDRIRQCVGLGMITVTLVGSLALLVVAAIAPLLSEQLGVLSTDEMRIVVMSAVGIFTLNGYQSVLTGVGIGMRRMVPPNVATTIGVTVNFALSIAALLLSGSLVVYALANTVAALLAIIPAYFSMRYVWHGPYSALPERKFVKEVLSFSLKSQVGWLAELVNFQTDKIVIAIAVDVRAAAVYEIASRVVQSVRSVAVLTVSAMIPTAAARIVSEGKAVIGEMYRRYTLRTCAIAFPLFVIASASAPFLLVFWLGKVPGDADLLVPFLTLAYLVNITTGVGSSVALAAGQPGMVSLNSLLIAGLNIVFTVALAPFFGMWGVVGGTFLALMVGGVLFTERVLKLFELPLHDFLAGVLPTGALALGLGIPPAALAITVGAPSGRLVALVLLVVSVLVYGPPYWIIASRHGYLPDKLAFPVGRRRASPTMPAA